MVVEYILANPSYIIVFVASMLAVALLFFKIQKEMREDEDDDEQDDGDGGIILDSDPDLDLPPGVTLPVDDRTPKESVLV